MEWSSDEDTYDEVDPCFRHSLNFIDDGDTKTKYYESLRQSPYKSEYKSESLSNVATSSSFKNVDAVIDQPDA